MKVLLDECLPRKLRRHLPGHEVFTVPEMGWAGVKNGALLRLVESAQPEFAVFLTMDGNLQYQQNLPAKKLAFAGEFPSRRSPSDCGDGASVRPGDWI